MKNNLTIKEDGLLNKVKNFIKNKFQNIFKQKKDFDILTQVYLGGTGRVFETENRFGDKYLFKPAESKAGKIELFRADIQAGMSKLQQKVNPQGSINCITITLNGLYGSIQEKIEKNEFDIAKWQLNGGEISQCILDGILREYVVDWAGCNFDAHGSNFIVDTAGQVRCCDKEQAFRYLFDKESEYPDLNYNPNAYVGEIEPIYNTIFKRFISGEIKELSFEIVKSALDTLNNIPDEEYISYFQGYISKLSTEQKEKYYSKILERKHNSSLYIKQFISDIIEKHKQKTNHMGTTALDHNDETLSVESQYTNGSLNKQFPIDAQLTIEDVNDDNQSRIEIPTIVKDKLAKYGITYEEYEELMKYKSSGYFLPTTLLHEISLFEYNMPAFGSVFENVDIWFKPENIMNAYCKIYSAMCKYGVRNNKDLHINRVGSSLFYNEMKKSGATESFLAHSNGPYLKDFFYGKYNNIVCVNGILPKGTPCINFSELEVGNDNIEKEILIPPFLNIKYRDTDNLIYGAYPEYIFNISKRNPSKLSEYEKENRQSLENSVKDSTIVERYYRHWYNTIRQNPSSKGNDEISKELQEEFSEWQTKLKQYLKLRFREIEYEINHPRVEAKDFLKWAIQRWPVQNKKGNEKKGKIVNFLHTEGIGDSR